MGTLLEPSYLVEISLAFGVTLVLAVVFSGLAERTVLSTAVIFLIAGFLCGEEVLGIVPAHGEESHLYVVADLALFVILFTDGMRVDLKDLCSGWRLPTRALALGMPLTLLATGVLAHFLLDLTWAEAMLVGAVLSPTDPVFASAVIGREEIPRSTRHVLNIESGVNDGLALPFVLLLLGFVTGEKSNISSEIWEILLGIALGVAVPWLVGLLLKHRFFGVSSQYGPLLATAVALVLFGLCSITHANEYLAAFSAGATLGNSKSRFSEEFERLGNPISELLKLAALMSFGAFIRPSALSALSWRFYAFAVLALVVPRTLALWIAFIRAGLRLPERLAIFWFGPKGFASVIYGLMVLQSASEKKSEMFAAIALVIAFSIVAHSSTDVPAAHWFERERERENGKGPSAEPAPS